MRDWSIGRLGCNVTERAIEKHDLMRGWITGRLGCNVTERAIERATGSSECREYRCFSNIQFKQRCWNFMHILLLWSCWDVAHAQKHFLVCTFTLDQVSVYAVGGTSVHPSCSPPAITWTLAPFQQLKTSTFGLMYYNWSLLLSSAIYYVSCPSTFISALLLSVHTHHFLLSYNAVFLDVETLHVIALFKIWLTPFAGI